MSADRDCKHDLGYCASSRTGSISWACLENYPPSLHFWARAFIHQYLPEFIRSALYDQILGIMKSPGLSLFVVDNGLTIALVIIAIFILVWPPTHLIVWWKRLNPYLIVAFFSAAIFIAAIIGYFIDKNSDKIHWDYDKWPDTAFLELQRSPDSPGYPIWVLSFRVIGTNTSDEPISQFSGLIRSKTTNITVPLMVLLRPSGGLVHPHETNGVPSKSEFVMHAVLPMEAPPKDGMSAAKFLRDFGDFLLVFNYDNKVSTRHFEEKDIIHQFDNWMQMLARNPFGNSIGPQKKTDSLTSENTTGLPILHP